MRTVSFYSQIPFLIAGLLVVGCEASSPSHTVIVLDSSGSVAEVEGACKNAVLATQYAIEQYGRDRRASVSLWLTGSTYTAFNPRPLLRQTPIPFSGSALEGREGVTRAQQELISSVEQACRSQLSPSPASPIFLAAVIAAQELHAQGCTADGLCLLELISDGQETVETSLKAAIAQPASANQLSTLPTIEASGIDVRICGTISSNRTLVGANSAELMSRTEAAWRAVFKDARSVVFRPQCP